MRLISVSKLRDFNFFVFVGKNEEPKQSFSFQKSSLIGGTVRRILQVQGPTAYCLCSGLLSHLSQTLTVHRAGLYLAQLRFHSQDTGMKSECYQGEQKVCKKKKRNRPSDCIQHQYLLMICPQLHSKPPPIYSRPNHSHCQLLTGFRI